MVRLAADIFIEFECKVSSTGYTLADRKKHKFKPKNGALMQKRPYKFSALIDFLSLIGPDVSPGSPDEDKYLEQRERFYERWGFLYSSDKAEDGAAFDALLLKMKQADEIRHQSGDGAPNFTLSDIAVISYATEHNAKTDEKIYLPVIRPAHLHHALEISWAFGAYSLNKVTWETCKYYRQYGLRKDCLVKFPKTRRGKKFCCKQCKDYFNIYKSRREANQ